MPFVPHTENDIKKMLATIGVENVKSLFDEIPSELRIDGLTNIGNALTESEISDLMRQRARQDGEPICFIGGGAYDHYVPAVVWDIATRGEFYSAYTPYQAEASQGTLQVIYEFQSMLASLTGLEVSNASLYDGATAFAEACLMAVRANRKCTSKKILVPYVMHPLYRKVAEVLLKGQAIELIELPMLNGLTDQNVLTNFKNGDFAALCIQQPSFFGTLEAVDNLTDWAHAQDALVIAVTNPMSLAVLRPPGQWGDKGADIACGEGQPLGIPVSSGGPYIGFLTCKKTIVRQMPGRIVGRTIDIDGKPGFTLTLQAREQHIRRSRATSNICTNQGLMATAATIYMSLMGASGISKIASTCNANTYKLLEALTAIPGVERTFPSAIFHEAVISFKQPVSSVLEQLALRGILGGFDLSESYPELENPLLICATENRSDADIRMYADALREILGAS
ncbi:MAG: aminomethyl-transferring glycine dehydrogenase subunit GcvPA [Pseudomonadota bacterium]|nr:aminomethyl-transferring glycine dehydrogenase subunit GcvPA [Pseudomonadota bacterium]